MHSPVRFAGLPRPLQLCGGQGRFSPLGLFLQGSACLVPVNVHNAAARAAQNRPASVRRGLHLQKVRERARFAVPMPKMAPILARKTPARDSHFFHPGALRRCSSRGAPSRSRSACGAAQPSAKATACSLTPRTSDRLPLPALQSLFLSPASRPAHRQPILIAI